MCFALLAGVVANVAFGAGSTSAQADLDAGRYVDPVYLFAFEWDPALYEAEELVGEDDVPYGVNLSNELEYGGMSAGGYSSTRTCMRERADLFEALDGVSDFEEADDLDWPRTDEDARATLYRYEYENPDTGDTGTFVQYFECRDLLIGGEPTDDVVLTFDMGIEEASYEDAMGAWEDILGSVEWDVEGGSTGNNSNNGNQSGGGEGVDGNSYIDPLTGWGVTWDEDLLTGENWLNSDDDIQGVQLSAESGSFMSIFTGEASSARRCVSDQVDALEGSAFSNFEEDERSDLPQTGDDARAGLWTGIFTTSQDEEVEIYLYADCRPLIVDEEEVEDQFIIVNIIGSATDYDDEIDLWSDVLTAIEYDVAGGSSNEDPDPEPTSSAGTEGSLESDAYVSALGYSLGWNDALFTAAYLDEENPDRGITLSSEGSYITIQAAGDPDAEACVEAEVSVLEGFDGMGRISESDADGPRTARGAEGGLFESTLETDSGEIDLTIYIECRPIGELDDVTLFVVVSMIGFGDLYADELPEWEAILDSIEIAE
jgi:hypothetical protein